MPFENGRRSPLLELKFRPLIHGQETVFERNWRRRPMITVTNLGNNFLEVTVFEPREIVLGDIDLQSQMLRNITSLSVKKKDTPLTILVFAKSFTCLKDKEELLNPFPINGHLVAWKASSS